MTHPAIDYSRYQTLAITRRGVNDAVIDIQMKAQNGKLPTAGHEGHWELSEIWRDIDKPHAGAPHGLGLPMSPALKAEFDKLR